MKKMLLLCTALVLLLCACASVETAPTATAEPSLTMTYVPQTMHGQNGLFFYDFTGDHAKDPGYACGTVTLKGKDVYTLCWADENGALVDYEEIAVIDAMKKNTFVFEKSIAIPQQATRLLLRSENTEVDSIVLPEEKLLAGTPDVSFASVSDIHLNYNHLNASAKWRSALKWFKELELPFVVSAGDIGEKGSESEYKQYIRCIESAGYTQAEVHEAMGNHDTPNLESFLATTAEGVHSGSEPYYYILKQGEGRDNLFIFMASQITEIAATNTQDNFTVEQMNWVEELVKDYSGKANIFLVQHAVMRNFGPGDRYNGAYVQPMLFSENFTQNCRLRQLLMEHKEIIMLNGHTHLSIREGLNFSDEYARIIHNGSVSQPRSYTASGSISYDSEGKTTAKYGSEGYVVRVYSDAIVFQGADLSTKKIIPTVCFIMPVM